MREQDEEKEASREAEYRQLRDEQENKFRDFSKTMIERNDKVNTLWYCTSVFSVVDEAVSELKKAAYSKIDTYDESGRKAEFNSALFDYFNSYDAVGKGVQMGVVDADIVCALRGNVFSHQNQLSKRLEGIKADYIKETGKTNAWSGYEYLKDLCIRSANSE